MHCSTLAIALTALAGFAAAQQNASDCCSLQPNTVPADQRESWCLAERNSCPEICGGQTSQNNCDPDQLTFSCECYGSKTPNISDYAQTLPSLMCQEWVAQCVNDHPNDLDGITQCRNVACGTKNASAVASVSSSASSSASSTAASSSGSSTATAASSAAPSSSGAAVPFGISREASTGLVGAILFAVFGLAL